MDKFNWQDEFEAWARSIERYMPFDLQCARAEGEHFYASNITNAAYCAYVAGRFKGIPEEAAPAPMPDLTQLTAFDFAQSYAGNEKRDSDLAFAISNENTARQLHNFASCVKAGMVYLQSVRVRSIQKIDDFPMSLLSIVFVPTRPKK